MLNNNQNVFFFSKLETHGEREVLGYIRTGEIFGEISFVSNKSSVAHVIAHTEIEVSIIEGYFINTLINVSLISSNDISSIYIFFLIS